MILKKAELATLLHVDESQVNAWVDAGMPHAGDGNFVDTDVRDWLIATGTGEEQVILKTRDEVSSHFGVGLRTVATWLTDSTFPGRSGVRSGRNGHFPVSEIEEWLLLRKGNGETSVSSRERLTDIRAEREEIKLRKDREEVIDADEVARFYGRTNSYAVSVLSQLAGRVDAALPSSIDTDARNAIRKAIQETVAECREMMAELIEGDKDDDETVNDGE